MNSMHFSASEVEQSHGAASHSLAWPARLLTAPAQARRTPGARSRVLDRFDIMLGCGVALAVLAVTYLINLSIIAQVPTSGDEPWYLLFGYSIIHNHTVDLTAVIHNHGVYSSFLGGVADDHTGDPLRNGVRVLPNLPGYAALVGLVYSWGGRAGVVLMQAGFAAFTAALLYVEARRLFGSRALGVFAGLGMLAAAPALLYVGQIFPSTVAAAFVFLGFVAASRWIPEARGWRLAIAVGALALAALMLPWLHFRYLLASLVLVALGVVVLYGRYRAGDDRRHISASLVSLLALAGLNLGFIGWYCRHYFGTWTPPVNLTRGITLGLLHPDVLRGLGIYYVTLLNPQAGLLPWAPLLLLAPVGLFIMWRRARWSAVCAISLLVGLMATLASAFWSDQVYQGYAFPGRFAIEAIPLLVLAATAVFAWSLERIGSPSTILAATHAWLPLAPVREVGERRAGMPGRRGADVIRPLGAAALALACLVLLGAGIWFSLVASRTAYFLYYSPAGTREAYRHPHVLPLWWFQMFPDTGEQFWNGPVATSGILLGGATAAADGSGTVLSSAPFDLAPGRYVARFTFACAPDSGSVEGTGATLQAAVARRVGSYPYQTRLVHIASQMLDGAACRGQDTPHAVAVTFGSNGYEQTVFQVASSAGIKDVQVTVSIEQATGG